MSLFKRILAQGLRAAGAFVVAFAASAQTPGEAPSLWYARPATTWTEALPLGNGRMGAMDFGGLEDARLQINENTLWGGIPRDYANSQAYAHLDDVRKLIFSGNPGQAEELAKGMLGDPPVLSTYLPFVDIHLRFPGHAQASTYVHRLDLADAIASTMYSVGEVHYRREVFISYPDQVIVVRLAASKPGALNFNVDLQSPHGSSSVEAKGSGELALVGQIQPKSNPVQSLVQSWDKPGEKFAALLKVSADQGRIDAIGTQLQVSGATTATLIFSGGTSFRNYRDMGGDGSAVARRHVEAAATMPYESLRKRHVDDYHALFSRVELGLGPSLTDKPTDERLRSFALDDDPSLLALYYAFGRYLLISSSRPGGQPANLQGLWNDELMPAWGSKWTTNINLEMNYWLAETGDLWEMEEPLWRMIRDLRETGAEIARTHYRARGWVLHHNTDLWRATTPVDGVWGLWPMGGVWLSNQMWDHYAFSGDESFLRQDAYPAMKGSVEFVLDMLVEAPEGAAFAGKLVTNPSTSPENQYLLEGKPHYLTYGSTMDIELIGELFDHFERASTQLGMDDALRARVERARRRLPALQIGRRGQLQEWAVDYPEAEISHRHVSHLYALYPGRAIDMDRTPRFAAAARRTLELRGDGGTGWSQAWRIALWARLRDPVQAYTNLKLLLVHSTLPNMFDVCPPFQIDGNFGGVAGMTEMLIQSGDGDIRMLPALPREWPEGHLTGVRVRGGGKVDMAWKDGRLTSVALRSGREARYRLVYGDKTASVRLVPGRPVVLDGNLEVASGRQEGDDVKPKMP